MKLVMGIFAAAFMGIGLLTMGAARDKMLREGLQTRASDYRKHECRVFRAQGFTCNKGYLR